MYATLRAARRHKGLSFVRILQRCPVFTPALFQKAVQDPANIALLTHDDGVVVPEIEKIYKNKVAHDPHDLDAARRLAGDTERLNLGVFFRDQSRPCYEDLRRVAPKTAEERVTLMNAELDRYAV